MTNADITIRLTDEQVQKIVETALADVGRLKTDAEQAVVDAAKHGRRKVVIAQPKGCRPPEASTALAEAVDALEASKADQ